MKRVESGYELRVNPSMAQRIYWTDRKPYFFIELFLFLDIPELPKYPDDLLIHINKWLDLSLIRD